MNVFLDQSLQLSLRVRKKNGTPITGLTDVMVRVVLVKSGVELLADTVMLETSDPGLYFLNFSHGQESENKLEVIYTARGQKTSEFIRLVKRSADDGKPIEVEVLDGQVVQVTIPENELVVEVEPDDSIEVEVQTAEVQVVIPEPPIIEVTVECE